MITKLNLTCPDTLSCLTIQSEHIMDYVRHNEQTFLLMNSSPEGDYSKNNIIRVLETPEAIDDLMFQ